MGNTQYNAPRPRRDTAANTPNGRNAAQTDFNADPNSVPNRAAASAGRKKTSATTAKSPRRKTPGQGTPVFEEPDIALRKKKPTVSPSPATADSRERDKARRKRKRRIVNVMRVRGGVDRPLLVVIVLLLCFGSIMVFSASNAYALHKYGDSYYYIKRQILFAAIGLAVMFGVSFMDYRIFQHFTVPVFLVVVVLLIITPIYGLAAGVARRWIIIAGVRFQPSELMKLALVMMLAWYYDRFEAKVNDRSNFMLSSQYSMFIPFGIVMGVCLLIMLENHFSCMIIMFLIGMSVMFVGGARKLWFGIGGASVGVLLVFAISLSSYARERVDVFLHPEKYSAQDEVWQTLQGLYAIGSGGLLGVGLGNSRQKHMFVSEPQNDFIFSIICEELGMVGALAVIALFILFVWRGLVVSMRAPNTYSKLVAFGITAKVAIQAVLNMGVVTGVLPNTGISLPFFSYGGTSLVVLLIEMGVLLAISRYSYEQNVT